MTGYILDEKKTFEIFVKTEEVLKKHLFSIMAKFESEELNFWIKTAEKYMKKDDRIIEIGCGSGRVIKELSKAGFSSYGFDNNPLFVNYCKKQNLKVFYFDATQKGPKEHRFKYKVVGIALNTLFNFPKKIRRKWISCAYGLLKKKGILIITAYSDNKFARRTIKERVKFYETVLEPPKDYYVEFFENNESGIRLCDKNHKEKFFSRWIDKKELLGEIKKWKEFKLCEVKLMDCRIGWAITLIK